MVSGRFGPDFPGAHFLGDLLQLSFASSQRDLFEDGWLEFVVRVYWLKARFLALQVGLWSAAWGGCAGTQWEGRELATWWRVCVRTCGTGHWALHEEVGCGGERAASQKSRRPPSAQL